MKFSIVEEQPDRSEEMAFEAEFTMESIKSSQRYLKF
jgi:hypothetical protein